MARREAGNGDIVFPLHFYDNQKYIKAITVDFMYRFDDVLDPVHLRTSFERLLEIGNWRKLGARIHRRPDGGEEYYIPREFTDKRPGFNYWHQQYDLPIAKHSLASKVPRAGIKPTTYSSLGDFYPVFFPTDGPTKFRDWVNTDRPVLNMCIVTFQDATLVSFRWPHCLMDAMGFKSVMEAWMAVLEEREQDVRPLTGHAEDPVGYITTEKANDYLLHGALLRGYQFLLWIFMLIIELTFYKEEDRIVCIPKKSAARLFADARRELDDRNTSKDTEVKFLSDSDILYAFWAKAIVKAQTTRLSRMVTMNNIVDLRGRLKDDALGRDDAYLGNATIASATQLCVKDILNSSICELAIKLRQDLKAQATKEQCEAQVAVAKSVDNVMWGPWDELLIILTNWNRGKFFTHTLLGDGKGEEGKRGRPTWIGSRSNFDGIPPLRNIGAIFGVDGESNWWFYFMLRKSAWASVETSLAELD